MRSLLVIFVLAGCGNSDTPPPSTPAQPTATAPPTTTAPPTATAVTPPTATATPIATGNAGTPLPPTVAGTLPGLQSLAGEAAGGQPDGSAFGAQLQEGQILTQPINLQGGKCYTVIAAGAGITQLEVQLVAQPAPMLPPTVLAQSTPGANGTAVLGGKTSGCFKNPLAIGSPAKVIVKATKGAGIAAAQVYSK